MGKIGEMIISLGADNANLKKGMKESQNIIQSTMDTISNIKGELLSIGTVAGPIAAVRSWAAAVNDLEDKTDMAGESASKLLAVGQFVGLTTEDMAGAMTKMSKATLTAAESIETANASGTTSTDVFTRFGIQILDTNGKLLSAEQIFDNVNAKHREMANGIEKTAMEMEIFGRSGAKLNDLLNLSAKQIEDVKDVAEKTGLVMSHETTQAFEDATFEVNKSKLALQGLAVSIGAEMLPQVQSASQFLSDLAVDFASLDQEERQNIATALEVAAAVSTLSIGWRGLTFLAGPLISALGSAAAAYDVLAASAWGAKAAVAGVIATVAAAAIYKGYSDYQHAENGGEFEYDDLGNVTQKQGTAYTKYNSDDYDTISENFNPSTGEYDALPKKAASGGSLDFSGSGGGGKGSGSADKTVKEVEAINKQISELKQKTAGLATDWKQAELEIAKAGTDGGALVLASIYTEGEARKKSVDDWLIKVNNSTTEAQQIYDRAVKSGDADAIASATTMLETRKAAEIQAAQEAADAKKEIDKQTVDELMSNATALKTFKDEINEAMRQGDYDRFMASMTDENVALAEQMSERQAIMQQYYDWRMEAEQSFAEYSLKMADQLKTSLGDAAANAIVYGKSFSAAMSDMVKSIAAMYIKWAVEKLAAAALGKAIMKQETAAVETQGASMAEALAPAAWAKLVLDPGSAVTATALLTAGMATAALIGGGISGLSSGSGLSVSGGDVGDTSSSYMSAGDSISVSGGTIEGVTAFASGGIVTAPTLALIGEAGEDEAVIPLSRLGDMLGDTGHGDITQIIYGDINTGADQDDVYSDFENAILNGLRGA
jgi:TP901 family phage tail tape measure protein